MPILVFPIALVLVLVLASVPMLWSVLVLELVSRLEFAGGWEDEDIIGSEDVSRAYACLVVAPVFVSRAACSSGIRPNVLVVPMEVVVT